MAGIPARPFFAASTGRSKDVPPLVPYGTSAADVLMKRAALSIFAGTAETLQRLLFSKRATTRHRLRLTHPKAFGYY
jgi:hypothetical protein